MLECSHLWVERERVCPWQDLVPSYLASCATRHNIMLCIQFTVCSGWCYQAHITKLTRYAWNALEYITSEKNISNSSWYCFPILLLYKSFYFPNGCILYNHDSYDTWLIFTGCQRKMFHFTLVSNIRKGHYWLFLDTFLILMEKCFHVKVDHVFPAD